MNNFLLPLKTERISSYKIRFNTENSYNEKPIKVVDSKNIKFEFKNKKLKLKIKPSQNGLQKNDNQIIRKRASSTDNNFKIKLNINRNIVTNENKKSSSFPKKKLNITACHNITAKDKKPQKFNSYRFNIKNDNL